MQDETGINSLKKVKTIKINYLNNKLQFKKLFYFKSAKCHTEIATQGWKYSLLGGRDGWILIDWLNDRSYAACWFIKL